MLGDPQTTVMRDIAYFPRLLPASSSGLVEDSDITTNTIQQAAQEILDVKIQPQNTLPIVSTGLLIYDTLSHILPFSSRTAFLWRSSAHSLASMLDTASFPQGTQLSFLLFFYARILGFLGPLDRSRFLMTVDGSPIEFSWVIPTQAESRSGEPTRKIRFTFEPLHPETGRQLRGAEVLDYLTSAQAQVGCIRCKGGGREWSKKVHSFLFPDSDFENGTMTDGSRFILGFDLHPSGLATLKAYYVPASRISASIPTKHQFPIYSEEQDFTPLRELVASLDPSMAKPLEQLIDYFGSLDNTFKPSLIILAVDYVSEQSNRLKIYFHTSAGTSLSSVKQFLTLGSLLDSPAMQTALDSFQSLWYTLFPDTKSSDEPIRWQRSSSEFQTQYPTGGFVYYYEIAGGKNTVFPKVYLPVCNYCPNDSIISQRLEDFYGSLNVHAHQGDKRGQGWVGREVARAFKNTKMETQNGTYTYIGFAIKQSQWDLISYFSPKVWSVGQQDVMFKSAL